MPSLIGGLLILSSALVPTVHAQELASQQALLTAPLSTSTVKEAVVNAFGMYSVMVKVAQCESGFVQFGTDGKVFKGVADSDDTGAFQINKRYHLKESVKLGLDINTLQGNIAYAKLLYAQEGLAPWSASKYCWNK